MVQDQDGWGFEQAPPQGGVPAYSREIGTGDLQGHFQTKTVCDSLTGENYIFKEFFILCILKKKQLWQSLYEQNKVGVFFQYILCNLFPNIHSNNFSITLEG